MNPLFNSSRPASGKIRDMARAVKIAGQVKKLISGKDPSQVVNILANTNPQFAEFWQKNANRPIQDVLKDYGIDPDGFQEFLKLF